MKIAKRCLGVLILILMLIAIISSFGAPLWAAAMIVGLVIAGGAIIFLGFALAIGEI